MGTGADPHRKAGVIVRRSLDADSPYADAVVHGDGLTSLQFRRAKGALTEEVRSEMTGADVCSSSGRARPLTLSAARFGEPFTHQPGDGSRSGRRGLRRPLPVLAQPGRGREGRLPQRPLRPTRPGRLRPLPRLHREPPRDPRRADRSGSLVVHASAEPFEAPNWTRDGAAAHLQHQRAGRGAGTAPSLRPRHADLVARSTPASPSGTTTTTSSRSTARCSASATRARPTASPPSTRCRRAAGPRSASPRSPPRTSTAGRRTGSHLVYTGGRNGEYDIYSIPADGSGDGDAPHLLEGARRRTGVHAGRAASSTSTRPAAAPCRSGG